MELRHYQENAVEWILEHACATTNARLLVVLPMGAGKSVVAAALLKIATIDQGDGFTGLFVAHRQELLDNARRALVGLGVADAKITQFHKNHTRLGQIVLASADALRAAQPSDWPIADVLITDEAHRDAGLFRRDLRGLFKDALRVGFTATPERLDGQTMRDQYEHMLVAAQPSELIAEGHIVAPRIYTVPPERLPDLRGVSTVGGDFDQKTLEHRTNTVMLLGDIVEHWKRMANGRRTIVFAVSRAHSESIAKRFRASGIAAERIDGWTNRRERKRLLAAFEQGEIRILASSDLLSEGIDIPSVKCVIMARPTASLAVCNQQAGRCMRPWAADGEDSTALILDHAGNVLRHGYPHADREWSLDGIKGRINRQVRATPIVMCPRCNAVVPAGLRCTACSARDTETIGVMGHGAASAPGELPGELMDLASAVSKDVRKTEYARLAEFARIKGFDAEWVCKVYMAKFHAEA